MSNKVHTMIGMRSNLSAIIKSNSLLGHMATDMTSKMVAMSMGRMVITMTSYLSSDQSSYLIDILVSQMIGDLVIRAATTTRTSQSTACAS